ncbi:hypothetical protein [Ekhidna sp.]
MKHIYRSLLVCMIALFSCEDPDSGPLFLYSDLETGTYIRLVENSNNPLVDLDNFSSYTFTYTVEFVGADQGASVQSYTADLVYRSGTNETTQEDFISLQASDFSVNDDGFVEATISVTSAELIGAFGITEASLSPEDEFEFLGEIVTPTRTFNSVNSSATVEGAFFQGYFDFTLFVGCQSSLEGEYTATTTTINCSTGTPGSASVTYTVEISNAGTIAIGEYEMSDWTFGVLEDCLGDGDGEDDLAQEGFQFQDVCGVVSFSSTSDEFGTAWSYSSVVNGNDWEITWSNPDTGMSGFTVINFPNGVPFTVM